MKTYHIISLFAILMAAGAGFSEVMFRGIITYYVVIVSYAILREKL